MGVLKTKFVTIDEIQSETGIDLREELGDKAEFVLKDIERRMESFIASNFYRNINREFADFSDYQKEHFKKAIIEQVIYILDNGDVGLLSGIEDGRKVANKSEYKNAIFSPYAEDELRLCGVWCRTVKNVGRGITYGDWLLR